jgi:hypothetical protein
MVGPTSRVFVDKSKFLALIFGQAGDADIGNITAISAATLSPSPPW